MCNFRKKFIFAENKYIDRLILNFISETVWTFSTLYRKNVKLNKFNF